MVLRLVWAAALAAISMAVSATVVDAGCWSGGFTLVTDQKVGRYVVKVWTPIEVSPAGESEKIFVSLWGGPHWFGAAPQLVLLNGAEEKVLDVEPIDDHWGWAGTVEMAEGTSFMKVVLLEYGETNPFPIEARSFGELEHRRYRDAMKVYDAHQSHHHDHGFDAPGPVGFATQGGHGLHAEETGSGAQAHWVWVGIVLAVTFVLAAGGRFHRLKKPSERTPRG